MTRDNREKTGKEHIITIEHVSFQYEDKWVLQDIDLQIPSGVFTVILGPNGSGKSTLLKNMCRALQPQKGTIRIDNVDIKTLKPKDIAKKVAIVHQNTNMNFGLTCREIVLMGRYAYQSTWKWQSSGDDQIAEECMRYCGVWVFRDKSVTELSGGEMQRVMIARALAQQSEILLMDEPVASLDLKYQVEILSLCRTLIKEKGVTIVAPVHDINLAMQFADMTILMREGRVLQFGKTAKVVIRENIENLYDTKVNELVSGEGHSYYFPAMREGVW